jgi:hypothetical protein
VQLEGTVGVCADRITQQGATSVHDMEEHIIHKHLLYIHIFYSQLKCASQTKKPTVFYKMTSALKARNDHIKSVGRNC